MFRLRKVYTYTFYGVPYCTSCKATVKTLVRKDSLTVPVPRINIIGRTNLHPPCRADGQNGRDVRASSLLSHRQTTSTPCLWRLIMQDCQAFGLFQEPLQTGGPSNTFSFI
ncbi:hypothetical protein MGYG_04496 [Nannizzia gypsea CBS 118893]|uniref:Glutaredoxin domain-containing protein n=1 Tax=Arthroderma gypseum (strain ATCC MYA-4604 / CBS 118893) TaxID=535722 RepID=E4UTE3_ARTGP|nr:hypothetical protein MGYG_04496 [Nannizzia gypsea CBS 118893]EFR01488.1 hypothetical protein MGYG_04496 [Nannizzia gypsea CBS 118893]